MICLKILIQGIQEQNKVKNKLEEKKERKNAKPEILICFLNVIRYTKNIQTKPENNWKDDRKPLPFPNARFKKKIKTTMPKLHYQVTPDPNYNLPPT